MGEVRGFAGRGGAFQRDWTQGSIPRNLLALSWPMIISSSLGILGSFVDMLWVGRLGSAPIAGVGVAGMAVTLVLMAMTGLATGVRAMVARFIGTGDAEGANHVARQAFVVSAAYSAAVALLGIFSAEPILVFFGLEADVVAEGAAYMRIMFLGSAASSFRVVTESIMQASGDAVTPMKITIFSRFFHILLDPFLIFGWWLFPRLGVSGAAITNVISQSLGMFISLWVLFTGRTRLRLTLRGFRLDAGIIWRIVRIGIPAAVHGIERHLSQLVLMRLLVPFGTVAVAAHTLLQRIEMLIFVPMTGLGTASGVLVGQNLGSRQPGRAERSGWLAVGLAEVFMFVCSVIILLLTGHIIGIFNTEPELVKLGSVFLRIAVVGYLLLGFNAVLQPSINGAGDTLPPMLISLIMGWLVQLPLAFWLTQASEVGVYGVRWAIAVSTLMSAISYITYFRVGRWQRKKV